MLDPKEQAKGGFRAQRERQREGQNAHMTATDAPGAKSPDPTPTPSEPQADGGDAPKRADSVESTTPGARAPKRWH